MNNYSIKASSYVDETGALFFDVSFQDGKKLVEKRISAKMFLGLLDDNLTEKETYVTVPKLNSNILCARISVTDNSSFQCLSIYPAQKRAFSIAGELFYLPFPALLMYLAVHQGIRQEVDIFSLRENDAGEESMICHYPFGNVHSDGGVCMGNIVSEKLKSIQDTNMVFDDFICGVTNQDLYRFQNTMKLTQLELVRYIEKKELFPSELLLPTGYTLGQLMKAKRMNG